jgi:hypothetical protein
MQAHKAALLHMLRHLEVHFNGRADLQEDDPQMKLVLAFASLIHEQRIMFRSQATKEGLEFLKGLVEAAFKSRATSQSGVVSYLLLGAATEALEEFFHLARGNDECFAALSSWENATITHRGSTLWSHALKVSKDKTGVRMHTLPGPSLAVCVIRIVETEGQSFG